MPMSCTGLSIAYYDGARRASQARSHTRPILPRPAPTAACPRRSTSSSASSPASRAGMAAVGCVGTVEPGNATTRPPRSAPRRSLARTRTTDSGRRGARCPDCRLCPHGRDSTRQRLEPGPDLSAEGSHPEKDHHSDRRDDQPVLDHILRTETADCERSRSEQKLAHRPGGKSRVLQCTVLAQFGANDKAALLLRH